MYIKISVHCFGDGYYAREHEFVNLVVSCTVVAVKHLGSKASIFDSRGNCYV